MLPVCTDHSVKKQTAVTSNTCISDRACYSKSTKDDQNSVRKITRSMNIVNQKDKAKPSIQHPEHFNGTHVEIDPGRSPIKSFFKLLGPGLITGASDDDPSGIATYSTA